jgi:hexosaminidase
MTWLASPRLLATLFAIVLTGCAPLDAWRDGTLQPLSDNRPDTRPQTIPALQQWTSAVGKFQLSEGSRIVLISQEQELRQCADLFAEEIASRTGVRPAVQTGSEGSARPGDIQLEIGPVASLASDEGYRLEIGASLAIRGVTDTGVFYGSRTVLQLLGGGNPIPAGVALDWPRYPERGMVVDIARKHYSAAWLERHIRELAYLKMNYLQLHISDNEGFGIKSDLIPEDPEAPERLTKKEVRRLVVLAHKYHVMLVPEIDMPGHMGAILKPVEYQGFRFSDGIDRVYENVLDITQKKATDFAFSLVTEFLDLFDSPYWHGGSDEILLCMRAWCHPKLAQYARTRAPNPPTPRHFDGKDALHAFLNDLDDHVAARDRKLRVWNDELKGGESIPLHSRIIIHWWTQFSLGSDWLTVTPQSLLEADHAIFNNGVWPTYYVLGAPAILPNASMKSAYESWTVNQFAGYLHPLRTQSISPAEPRNLGAALAIWADHPDAETEDEIGAHIVYRLRVIAQKTWESELLTPRYEDFRKTSDRVGHAPGF